MTTTDTLDKAVISLGAVANRIADERNDYKERVERLIAALQEIETICTESAGATRKRMGTRVGNCLVTARTALAQVGAA